MEHEILYACCPWLVLYFQTLSAKPWTPNRELTARQHRQRRRNIVTNSASSSPLLSSAITWSYSDPSCDHMWPDVKWCSERTNHYKLVVRFWWFWCRSNLHFYCASCVKRCLGCNLQSNICWPVKPEQSLLAPPLWDVHLTTDVPVMWPRYWSCWYYRLV